MKVLVTGAGGYIGTTLVPRLIAADHDVKAVDRFFFGRHLLPEAERLEILAEDNRKLTREHFEGVDAVIDLAAISNDPSGELFQEATWEINRDSRVRNARMAKEAGARRYILPSSCSIYGFQEEGVVADETSGTNPLTVYARANEMAEKGVLPLADEDFCVVVLRQATVYGLSPRMRFDLAINGMTFGAWKTGRLPLMRDGAQWRPMVHVRDTARAQTFMLEADPEKVNGRIFNVGSAANVYRSARRARRPARSKGSRDRMVRRPRPAELQGRVRPGARLARRNDRRGRRRRDLRGAGGGNRRQDRADRDSRLVQGAGALASSHPRGRDVWRHRRDMKAVLLGPNGQARRPPRPRRRAVRARSAGASGRTAGGGTRARRARRSCQLHRKTDEVEDNASPGFSVNAPQATARACAAERALFVHVSTDYAFGGDPCGAVAGRRRAGQRLRRLQGDGGNSGRTARTSSSFAWRPWTAGASGKGGGNFVETIAGKEKGALRAVDDQTMSPTATASRVVLRILASGGAPYHAVNDGAATWSPAKSSASPEPS